VQGICYFALDRVAAIVTGVLLLGEKESGSRKQVIHTSKENSGFSGYLVQAESYQNASTIYLAFLIFPAVSIRY